MNKWNRWGGAAALYEGTAYILGMLFFLLVVNYPGETDPAVRVRMLTEYRTLFYLVNTLIYILFGIALVILTLALHQDLKDHSPALMQTASVFGCIWAVLVIASGMIFNTGMERVIELAVTDPAGAAAAWLIIETVTDGIGGGNEIIGGIWILLVSIVSLKKRQYPRLLNVTGAVAGGFGVLSAIPPLGETGGIVFGLLQIIWFFWLGILLTAGREQTGPAV